ncbi:MAG: UDP-N-acetylmuramate--L-alanine ligase [Desulfobacterales bacterium]
MYRKRYHIHFVGIGGIGMSGIAELLLNLGYRVSGSDLRRSDLTERLAGLGGTVFIGHEARQVEGADVVVVSSAVREDNPEVQAAHRAGIPVIPRAEMLAELMRLKYSIAVAGAHGKTTTTSIIAALLETGGLDPTVVIGGRIRGVGTNAVLGRGEFIVAEADESDGSFLRYAPAIAVVTNIDREHLDYYPDLAAVQEAFLRFLDRIPFYGLAVLCLDDPPTQDLIPRVKKRYVTYGRSRQADYQIGGVAFEGRSGRFELSERGRPLGTFRINLPGLHNVYNAAAGIAVARELDIALDLVRQALARLPGVQRRMEVRGETRGAVVVDDYGHHPTEIRMTLQAIRECWPERRLVVVFQPHRYTRTRALFDDFARAFYQSDRLIVLPIYGAGEAPIEGVSAEDLCRAIVEHGHKQARYLPGIAEAAAHLRETLAPGDLVLTLGAGDVWKVGSRLLEEA